MSDILLLQPPVSFTNPKANSGFDTYPIGMAYVAASLREAGLDVRAINDSDALYGIKDIVQMVEQENVKVLGLSVLLATIPSAVKLAQAVKDARSDKTHIMLGNCYASTDRGVIDRYPCFDSALLGEAEITMPKLAERILAGEDVKGIIDAETPMDLDALPFPAYSMIENTVFEKGSLIPIIGTRGCPYRCGYCARQALSKKVRARSGDNIVSEMRERLPLTKRFYFQDDSATIKKASLLDLCRAVMESGLKVKFEMTTRLDLIDDEMVSALKSAGCERLIVGVESGNEKIRQEVIQKHLSNEDIYRGMEITRRNRMPVQLMFMIGHPGETKDDVMESIEFPLDLERRGFTNIEMVGYHITLPIPGTRYYDWCIENGQIREGLIDRFIAGELGDGYFGHWPYLIPDGLTLEEMMNYRKTAHQRFHLRPRYIMRRGLQSIKDPKQLWSDIKHAYHVVFSGTSSDISKTET